MGIDLPPNRGNSPHSYTRGPIRAGRGYSRPIVRWYSYRNRSPAVPSGPLAAEWIRGYSDISRGSFRAAHCKFKK